VTKEGLLSWILHPILPPRPGKAWRCSRTSSPPAPSASPRTIGVCLWLRAGPFLAYQDGSKVTVSGGSTAWECQTTPIATRTEGALRKPTRPRPPVLHEYAQSLSVQLENGKHEVPTVGWVFRVRPSATPSLPNSSIQPVSPRVQHEERDQGLDGLDGLYRQSATGLRRDLWESADCTAWAVAQWWLLRTGPGLETDVDAMGQWDVRSTRDIRTLSFRSGWWW